MGKSHREGDKARGTLDGEGGREQQGPVPGSLEKRWDRRAQNRLRKRKSEARDPWGTASVPPWGWMLRKMAFAETEPAASQQRGKGGEATGTRPSWGCGRRAALGRGQRGRSRVRLMDQAGRLKQGGPNVIAAQEVGGHEARGGSP